jgi:hypothetical protein
MISIFIVSQGFDPIVGCVEESAINASSTQAPVGVNLTNKLNSLTLLWNSPNLLELTSQKPHVMDSD